jgi:hypothetical protein
MKNRFIAAVVIAASTFAVAPVFASGYGPAPHYSPIAGAPASQRGPNAQTLHADGAEATNSANSYGGTNQTNSQAGSRASDSPKQPNHGHQCVGPVSFCDIYFGS